MPKETCLLTGAGGSIGIHTLSQLMKNTDWNVIAIDSFRHKGWCDRIENHLRRHPEDAPRIKIITHDLSAPFSELTKKRIGKIDYIINMASLSDVEASVVEPVPFVKNNIDLVLNMLEFAREVKPKAFIQISTDEVYGPTTGKNDGYKEWDAQVPSNPYAASKAAQEAIAISYWRAYGVPLIITNTMNNFGEMQSATKYPVMIQKALAKGETITIHHINGEIGSRSYIHSQNFANALIFLLKNHPPYLHKPGKVDRPDRYHIAGDRQIDNKELVELIAEKMGIDDYDYELVDIHSTRPGHDPHYGLNDDKIRNLGWNPPVSFEDGLKNCVEWQAANPEWIT